LFFFWDKDRISILRSYDEDVIKFRVMTPIHETWETKHFSVSPFTSIYLYHDSMLKKIKRNEEEWTPWNLKKY